MDGSNNYYDLSTFLGYKAARAKMFAEQAKRLDADFAENGWSSSPEIFNTVDIVRGCSMTAFMGNCQRCHFRNFPHGWNGETSLIITPADEEFYSSDDEMWF